MKLLISLMRTAALSLAIAGSAQAAEPITIALVHGLSGSSFSVFSKQTTTGFKLGLEYATGGTMEVNGHKIKVIEKDTQFKPDAARAVLAEAKVTASIRPPTNASRTSGGQAAVGRV